MLIGLEASSLHGSKSGVGYYTENLLSTIMRIAPEHRYILFSNRDMRDSWELLGGETIYDRHLFRVRAAWMQTMLPRALREVRPDICHFTNYLAPLTSGCPYIVTIYDMTLFVTPRLHRFKKLVLDRTLIPHVARRANAIITVSNSARDDIVRFLGVPRDKIRVIHGGVAPAFCPITDRTALDVVRARYSLSQPYILYVGTIEPRKNLLRLVQAFARLKKKGLPHKLAIVGQQGWHCAPVFAEVERLGLAHDVVFTGYVPFEDLPVLYSGAEVMAFPSLYEGFGLPVVEAMACGAPVVTSNTSSLSEVAGGAGLLVNPLSVDEISDALHSIHTDRSLRDSLSERGLARASHFTWEQSARNTLDLYEKVALGRAPAWKRSAAVRDG